VNQQITRLAVVAVVLLASLIVMTTYWQTWAATDLADRQDNALETVAALTVKRGKIYAGKTLIATNVKRRVGGQTLYFRTYPQGGLFSQVVGYSTQVRSRAGLEESENDFLTGANGNLSTVVDTTLDKLQGKTVTGNDIHLTLRPGAQRVAYQQLGGRCGAVVAIEPSTGRILVLASTPTYNPNLIEKDYNKVANRPTGCGGRLVNRATAGLYAPGSTFKVVTGSAALDSGKFKPTSTFDDPGYCEEYGKRVYNAETNSPFGVVTLAQGLQHSINSVFCNVGKSLGAIRILDKAKEFGFYSKPPLDLPSGEVKASGLYDPKTHKLLFPKNDFQVDPGRLAFGQERLGVTPLQMAMVAATVANKGVLMKPQLVERITSAGGKTVTKLHPQALDRAIKPETAAALNEMMQSVVAAGTGTNAQIPGIRVAGKTGTAETGTAGRNTTWFISFAPADDPKVAVAVVVENQPGAGNTYAAPVAKAVLQALLPKASNSHP
jgi:peptidoglycan glycosyltransferase